MRALFTTVSILSVRDGIRCREANDCSNCNTHRTAKGTDLSSYLGPLNGTTYTDCATDEP